MKKFFNKQSGFTLVELLVVIAIIAILGVVAIAAINPAARINAAKDNQALANVQQIGKAFEACLADKMSTGSLTQAAAVTACCTDPGTTAPYSCTSSATVGLGLAGYGYASGFPTGVTVNRTASTSTTPTICVSQVRGSNTNRAKYVTSGGTVVINATTSCTAGI